MNAGKILTGLGCGKIYVILAILKRKKHYLKANKAGYTATLVACGWAGAVLKKVTRVSGQE